MHARKIAAVFAVALMALTAFAIAPESDAEGGDTMEMVLNIDGSFERTIDKVPYYWVDNTRTDQFFTEEPQDELFQKYIDGESAEFLSVTVSKPVAEKMYYMYFVGGYNYYDEGKAFDRAAPTKVVLRPGTTEIRLMTDVQWVHANVDWNDTELKFGHDTELDGGSYGSTLVLSSEVSDFEHLQKVTVRFSDPSVIPERAEVSGKTVMSTAVSWYHADISPSKGYCDDDVFMFDRGSPYEQSFVDEVILGGKPDFKRSDYGILEKGDFPAGDYSVYRVVQDPNRGWGGHVNTWFGQAGDYMMPVFKERAKPYTLFSKAYTDMSLTLDFDETKYIVRVDIGYSQYELSSGYRYVIPSSYASEVKVYLMNLEEDSAVTDGEVGIEFGGMDTETGSPVGLAGLCILLSALVFAVLFLSNRKPHW